MKPTLAHALRSAARAARDLRKLINELAGVNGGVDAEIEKAVRAAIDDLQKSIRAARKLATSKERERITNRLEFMRARSMRDLFLSMRLPAGDRPRDIAMSKREAVEALLSASGWGIKVTGGGLSRGCVDIDLKVSDLSQAVSAIVKAMDQVAPEMDYKIHIPAQLHASLSRLSK
jgi:hypothetical protein